MHSNEYLQWLAPSSRKLTGPTGGDGLVCELTTSVVNSPICEDFLTSGSLKEERSVSTTGVNVEKIHVKNRIRQKLQAKTNISAGQQTGSQGFLAREGQDSQEPGFIQPSSNADQCGLHIVNVGQAQERAAPPAQPIDDGGIRTKKTRQRLILPQHVVTVENPGCKLKYHCQVCGRAFHSRRLIKQHVTHTDVDYPHQCNLCPRRFFTMTHLKYHQRCHAGERPYKCGQCGKGFKQRGALNRHKEIHTTTRNHVCRECSKAFKTKACLESHKLIHAAEPRIWQCIVCPKAFSSKAGLRKHASRAKTGPHNCVCGSCAKCLKKPETLKKTAFTIRQGKRPHQCKQCPRTYATPTDLERHFRVHTGEKPYPCKVCGTAFRRQDNAERHVMMSHGQPKELAKQLVRERAEAYRESRKTSAGNTAT